MGQTGTPESKRPVETNLRSYLSSEDVKADDPLFGLKFKGWNDECSSVERDAALYGAGEQNWSS
jgi:hypothetical protein